MDFFIMYLLQKAQSVAVARFVNPIRL